MKDKYKNKGSRGQALSDRLFLRSFHLCSAICRQKCVTLALQRALYGVEKNRSVSRNRYTVIYSKIWRAAGNLLHFSPSDNEDMEPEVHDAGNDT